MTAYSAKAPGPPAGEPSTRCPVSTISPHSSIPGVKGSGGFSWYVPCAIRTSGKFSAAARTFTRTWPGPGVGCSTSSSDRTEEGSPSSCTRHARMRPTLPDRPEPVSPGCEHSLLVAVTDGLEADDGHPRGQREHGEAPGERRPRGGQRH